MFESWLGGSGLPACTGLSWAEEGRVGYPALLFPRTLVLAAVPEHVTVFGLTLLAQAQALCISERVSEEQGLQLSSLRGMQCKA